MIRKLLIAGRQLGRTETCDKFIKKMFKKQPTLIVLRSKSGSGKSTLAQYIKGLNFSADIRVCEADSFFTDSQGNYNFNPALLGQAHAQCKAKFFEAMEDGVDIIISNTNTTRKERDFYLNTAKEKGYRVFSIILENLGTKDIHSLPPEVLARQKETLKNNIDL